MPLQDHFQGMLASRRSWTAFHSAWATYIAEDLNERLGAGYFAEPTAQFGIEIGVATWQESNDPVPAHGWKPSSPQMTLPFILASDVVEVLIHRNEGGPTLAAAVELVSPGNKDRPTSREAFVSKCAAYLHQGVGLVIVDIVTSRHADLHQALLERLSPETKAAIAPTAIYAAAYHPFTSEEQASLEVWHDRLTLGQPLPILPLWLRGGNNLPLDLEATYQRTVQKLKLPVNGQQ